jgi:CDP-diacylglycerol--glycerol-3-phosphate 3-phosphatidyltransferase
MVARDGGGAVAPEGLYRVKPQVQAALVPVAARLNRAGITANGLTLAALIIAGVGGLALALSPNRPALLLLVPVLAAARLVLNVLDGMVARASGRAPRRIGEVWNELGDRAADGAFLVGLAFVPAVGAPLAMLAIVAALFASYAGLAARAAGGRRLYGGIMSKPGRMITLAVASVLAFITASSAPLVIGTAVIAGGSVVTLVQRTLTAVRELDDAS